MENVVLYYREYSEERYLVIILHKSFKHKIY